MQFLDQCKIYLKSGEGGAGTASFRREKFVEFGGPDGGDGGRGGDIIFEVVPNLNTLIDYRYQQHFRAQNGRGGAGSNRSGAAGTPIILRVPAGTQVMDENNEEVLIDLVTPGQRVVFLRGGDGGHGNSHFKTSTNRGPRRFDLGWPGEERWVWLRLKLIADAGLVGLPNAGKSTFLAATSRARPKIADYPFTTLKPQLGVGIGTRFLGHVERCAVILHLIDGTQDDVVGAYRTIRHELAAYGNGLIDKPEVIGLNKSDSLTAEEIKSKRAKLKRATKQDIFVLSGVSGDGVTPVLGALLGNIHAKRAAETGEPDRDRWLAPESSY